MTDPGRTTAARVYDEMGRRIIFHLGFDATSTIASDNPSRIGGRLGVEMCSFGDAVLLRVEGLRAPERRFGKRFRFRMY